MGRIRTIKPEFPQSESMGRVSREARYCFILLWTIADDAGRLRGNSRMLASLLYPYDDDAPALIDSWLLELECEGCILRYKPDGNTYIQIANWLNHQKIDRPSASKITPPSDDSIIPRESSRIIGAGSKDQGSGIKDQGSVRGASSDAPTTGDLLGDTSEKPKRATRLPADWQLPDDWREWSASNTQLTGQQIAIEADKFRDYWTAQPGAKATKTDWQATWRNWCRSARPMNGTAKPSRHDISQIDYGPGGVYDL